MFANGSGCRSICGSSSRDLSSSALTSTAPGSDNHAGSAKRRSSRASPSKHTLHAAELRATNGGLEVQVAPTADRRSFGPRDLLFLRLTANIPVPLTRELERDLYAVGVKGMISKGPWKNEKTRLKLGELVT